MLVITSVSFNQCSSEAQSSLKTLLLQTPPFAIQGNTPLWEEPIFVPCEVYRSTAAAAEMDFNSNGDERFRERVGAFGASDGGTLSRKNTWKNPFSADVKEEELADASLAEAWAPLPSTRGRLNSAHHHRDGRSHKGARLATGRLATCTRQ